MNSRAKQLRATAYFSIISAVVLLIFIFDTFLDRLVPLKIGLLSSTYQRVYVSVLDLVLMLVVIIVGRQYFRRKGIHILSGYRARDVLEDGLKEGDITPQQWRTNFYVLLLTALGFVVAMYIVLQLGGTISQ